MQAHQINPMQNILIVSLYHMFPTYPKKFGKVFKKNYKLIYKPLNQLNKNTFSNLKFKISNYRIRKIVHEVPCKNWNDKYIGQTIQYLKNRIKMLISMIKKQDSIKQSYQ